jgi:hypothetical protein
MMILIDTNIDIDMPLTDELLQLQEFAAREGPAIVSESLRNLPDALQIDQENLLRFSERMFQDAVGLLLERFASIRPSETSRSQSSPLQPRVSQPEYPNINVHSDPLPDMIRMSAPVETIDQTPAASRPSRQPDSARNHDSSRKSRSQLSLGAFPLPVPTGPEDIQWGLPEIQDTLLLTPDSLEQLDQVNFYWGPLFEDAFTNENGM